MSDALSRLFSQFDRGTITRRQLLQALGLAAVSIPMASYAQGGGATRQQGDTTSAKPPFDPTGWKTISMDHFTMQCVDYEKEAAFYAALMGWTVRSDDGSKAVLDIGDDVGTVILRGGLEAPPAPAPQPVDTSAGGRGRGGNRAPVTAVWDSFTWGIDDWDRKKVEAELKKRGLNPVLDTSMGYDRFHLVDPGNFDVYLTDGKRKNRRGKGTASLKAPAPFDSTGWKTVWLDHISFACPSYKESVAFYSALLGWKPGRDTGSQNEVEIGELGNAIIRGGGGGGGGRGRGGGGDTTGRGAQPAPPQMRKALINHIAFGIQPFDPDKVADELKKRGLQASVDTGGGGDIHTANYKSYHTRTPGNWDLQISANTKASRNAR
jgi:catechol 2,3-dioxygenase-like lactoylglutathione lyase family enzyme